MLKNISSGDPKNPPHPWATVRRATSPTGSCSLGQVVIPMAGWIEIMSFWLVVEPTPLKNDGVRQLGL